VHQAAVAAGSIPVVESVDIVQVSNDQTAIAQVTAHLPVDPATSSARTFNLLKTPEGWKVCEPPA